jgi:hypothetical protein
MKINPIDPKMIPNRSQNDPKPITETTQNGPKTIPNISTQPQADPKPIPRRSQSAIKSIQNSAYYDEPRIMDDEHGIMRSG